MIQFRCTQCDKLLSADGREEEAAIEDEAAERRSD